MIVNNQKLRVLCSSCVKATMPSVVHARFFMIWRRARNDKIDARDNAEPIERTEPKDPIEPSEQAEPIEPMESTERLDPIDSNESSDQSDHLDVSVCLGSTRKA
jgi:hypothetical protein